MRHDATSLLRRPGELDELLSFLSDAADHHAHRSGSTALETALRCLPVEWLTELVAIAECGRQGIGRTVSDIEDLVRFGIGAESSDHLVRRLLMPTMPELIALGLERIADLPRVPGETPMAAPAQHRRRRTQPIVLPDSPPERDG
jgi:hypothetical protein